METSVLNKASKWIASGQYKKDIDDMCTAIIKKARSSQNEAQTADAFEKNMYYIIKLRTGIEVDFQKETTVKSIEHHLFGTLGNRTSGKGRLDGLLNNLVIEYKHNSKLNKKSDFNKAVEQIEDYLKALFEEKGERFNAILTDGIRIAYFKFSEDIITHSELKQLRNTDMDFVVKAIISNNKKQFVPTNIMVDFAIDPRADTLSTRLARTLYRSLKLSPTDKTKMLFQEWQSLMHLSINDNGKANDIPKRRADLSLIFKDHVASNISEYRALFALQTTYAIIVKLIACKIVDKLGFNSDTDAFFDLTKVTSTDMQSFFETMEDGYSYRSGSILNFLEGDFFSWYSSKEQWSAELWKEISQVVETIDQYSAFTFDFNYNPIDIFKDLYMSIIPRSIRHSMGEYFTPEWLADHVVTKGLSFINNEHWKAIDPCCGSGIFILSLIKHMVGDVDLTSLSIEEKAEIRDQILDRIHGIDINPLSVLSARVGYYLALQPFGELRDIEIPIYLGDSAIVPEIKMIDGIQCYHYIVKNEKRDIEVLLPSRFVKGKEFGREMNRLQAIIKTDDNKVVYEALLNVLNKREAKSHTIKNSIKKLSEQLTFLHKNNWDGIWIRIVTNFMLIARLEKSDFIVGNPPWVKWEHLPALYASKIKEECNIRHIFSADGQFGGTQLNICALIANVAATNWLSENGVLAFLMPDSIMSQNSYEGFRNFYVDYESQKRLYIQYIDRWLKPLRPFQCDKKSITQDFNTYYFSSKYVDYSVGFPVCEISKPKEIDNSIINSKLTYDAVLPMLIESNSKAVQLSDKTTAFSYVSNKYDFSQIIGSTSYSYRTGVEFTPQELYLLTDSGVSKRANHYKFGNKQFTRSKYKVDDTPKGGWDLPVECIYPILTAPSITPFHYDKSNEFCIIPYDKNDTKQPICSKVMLKKYPDLYDYLVRHKNLIDMQSEKSKQMHRGNEFYSLSKIGKYTFADYIVAARDNTHFCATVVSKRSTPWNEIKQTICVKHTIIISQRTDGSFITEDEAYYLTGILNSSIVVAYIETSFKSNGFSLNKSNLFLPCYDPKNHLHTKIVALSKKATSTKANQATTIKAIQEQVSELYIKLCQDSSK